MITKILKHSISSSCVLLLVFAVSCSSPSTLSTALKTIDVDSQLACEEKDGTWYRGKCWANFKKLDNNLSADEVDAAVDRQLAAISDFGVTLDQTKYDIELFVPQFEEEDKELVFISVFKKGDKKQTLVQIAPINAMRQSNFEVKSRLFDADLSNLPDNGKNLIQSYLIATGSAQATKSGDMDNMEDMELAFEGELVSAGADSADRAKTPYLMKAGILLSGIGNTTLEVRGTEAYLNGTLGTKAYKQFKDLVKDHPEVKTIVLENVPGSMNDAVNMHTGRLLKSSGLNTKVLATSEIASGGVDLFCAGNQRIVTEGAKLGVHSWGAGEFTANDLPNDHPAHQYQISDFINALGKAKGEAFYFYTLEAAPFNSIHWMSLEEIKDWKVGTQIVQ